MLSEMSKLHHKLLDQVGWKEGGAHARVFVSGCGRTWACVHAHGAQVIRQRIIDPHLYKPHTANEQNPLYVDNDDEPGNPDADIDR